MTIRESLLEFHRSFEQPSLERPTIPGEDRIRLRLKLIAEEFCELLEATGLYDEDEAEHALEGSLRFIEAMPLRPCNLVEVADALADLIYVIEGTNLEFGINGEEVFNVVHRSNMSKLDDDGRPVRRGDGKVLKGPKYEPADIAAELRRQGWQG